MLLLFLSTSPSDPSFMISYWEESATSLNRSDFVIKMGMEMPSSEDNAGKDHVKNTPEVRSIRPELICSIFMLV